jgi:type VI secretion system protein ImpH
MEAEIVPPLANPNLDTETNGPSPGPPRPPATSRVSHPSSLERRLFDHAYNFDFFQAVRLLHRLDAGRVGVGLAGPPRSEIVRFRAHISLSFPPSSIHELERPTSAMPVPTMTQAFMGLTGPNGVLPRHYTELLFRLKRDAKGPERYALRDWFDLFNHRIVSLFYRAWEKYRFTIPYERKGFDRVETDPFTNCLYSLIGLEAKPLRNRLRVSTRETIDEEVRERVLARVEDLVLLRFGGLLGHRPRCAQALEAMVTDYFELKAKIRQFQGQWLQLGKANRSSLQGDQGNNQLGITAVVGDRVWNAQSKFRIRLGPLRYDQFLDFLPDRSPVKERKAIFLLVHLVRLYVEPTLDFDIQLILAADEVPECQLAETRGFGARLGWNTWLRTEILTHDADDAVFEGEEVISLDANGQCGRLL